MQKRNYIEEILSIKSRTHESKRWDLVLHHMRAMGECSHIIDIIYDEEDYLNEKYNLFSVRGLNYIDQFYPIKCVACIEGYFKLLIANLIDFGNPFRDNARNFKDVKFSIDIVLSLQTSEITVGEFISHL